MNKKRNYKINCLEFKDELKIENINSIKAIDWNKLGGKSNWINIQDREFEKDIDILKRELDIHPLVMEDILNKTQRTKVETYGDFVFIVLHILEFEDEEKDLTIYNDLYILMKNGIIVTITRTENDIFNKLIEKMKLGNKNLFSSTNRLLFAILYEIVEDYFNAFEIMEDKVDLLDYELTVNNNYDIMDDLYYLRRNMIYMEKYITPMKIIVNYIGSRMEGEETVQGRFYYRDVQDNIENIVEGIKVYKELTSSIIETVNNMVNDRTNDITKVLTIWSTIFLPITFLSSVYGMNFKHMNGLEWKFAYPAFWIISIVIILFMIYYFKNKKWF